MWHRTGTSQPDFFLLSLPVSPLNGSSFDDPLFAASGFLFPLGPSRPLVTPQASDFAFRTRAPSSCPTSCRSLFSVRTCCSPGVDLSSERDVFFFWTFSELVSPGTPRRRLFQIRNFSRSFFHPLFIPTLSILLLFPYDTLSILNLFCPLSP